MKLKREKIRGVVILSAVIFIYINLEFPRKKCLGGKYRRMKNKSIELKRAYVSSRADIFQEILSALNFYFNTQAGAARYEPPRVKLNGKSNCLLKI